MFANHPSTIETFLEHHRSHFNQLVDNLASFCHEQHHRLRIIAPSSPYFLYLTIGISAVTFLFVLFVLIDSRSSWMSIKTFYPHSLFQSSTLFFLNSLVNSHRFSRQLISSVNELCFSSGQVFAVILIVAPLPYRFSDSFFAQESLSVEALQFSHAKIRNVSEDTTGRTSGKIVSTHERPSQARRPVLFFFEGNQRRSGY